MKSAAGPIGSEEAPAAARDTGCLGASDLLERVLCRPNLQAALKRVRQNKGSPGIDGIRRLRRRRNSGATRVGIRPIRSQSGRVAG
jgi:hypothetical protein